MTTVDAVRRNKSRATILGMLLFATMLIGTFGLFFSGTLTNKASAASDATVTKVVTAPDGTPIITTIDYSPVTIAGNICNSSYPVDFGASVSDPHVDVDKNDNANLVYDLNLRWKDCNSSPNNNRAYAIYSGVFCPKSGTYGSSGWAHDCVKYTGGPYDASDHTDNGTFGPGEMLSCDFRPDGTQKPGTKWECTTRQFKAIQAPADQPEAKATGGTNGNGQIQSLNGLNIPITSWSSDSNGHFNADGQLCEFYKTGAPNWNNEHTGPDTRCVDMNIDVKWTIDTPATPSLTLGCNTDGTGWATYTVSDHDHAGTPSAYLTVGNTPPGTRQYTSGGTYPANGSWPNIPTSFTEAGTWYVTLYYSNPPSTARDQTVTKHYAKCVPNAEPYFVTKGGDISAGNGLTQTPGACTSNNSASITGWNEDNSPANSYGGAGSGLGAFVTANNGLKSFVSGTDTAGGAATLRGHGLSFANYTGTAYVNPATYGDSYGAANALPCVSVPTGSGGNLPSTTLTNVPAGTYTVPSGTILNTSVLDGGRKIVIHTTGNIYINGNITYNYSQISDIPQLEIIAQGGGIYVSGANVTELHGVFISQKSSGGAGGVFATCATGPGAPTSDFTTCNHKLTVVGAVAAEGTVVLGRTSGTVTANPPTLTNTDPAEVFQYSPELWLNTALDQQGTPTYQAITSLPPVL